MRSRLAASAVAAACLVSSAVVGTVVFAAPASAAPATCNATAAQIYAAAPAVITDAPGTLLACRQTNLPNIQTSTAYTGYQIRYVSRDVHNAPIVVSGAVAVPKAAYSGGARPVVGFTPGTLGLGNQCALSKQLAGAYQDMYEGSNLGSFLNAGFAIAATDMPGYIDGQVHPYVVGESNGHALLDAIRASFQVPNGGLVKTTKVGLAGYSEGGSNSLWAAQLAASYAPDLNVVGAASGGVPGDLKLVASQLNGGAFAGFLADAAIGIAAAYPTLPFDSLLNATGKKAIATAKTQCLGGTLTNFLGSNISSFTTANLTLDQLYAQKGTDGVTWGQVLDAQKVGVNIGKKGSGAKYQIGFPVFQYRGLAEEVINTQATDQTRDRYCKAGITTQWNSGFIGEHLTTDMFAAGDVTSFLKDRFNGLPTFGNC